MFIDGISIWLAYYVWSLCPTAGGQESSTRYLKISADDLISPEELGISPQTAASWRKCMDDAFQAYHASLSLWEELARQNPAITNIPRSLLNDTSEAAQKKVMRMRRNFAFDRARYFLPVATATNVMLIMSARGWASLCQHLLSHPLLEPRQLGALIRGELEIAAPRMTRHARSTEPHQRLISREFDKDVRLAASQSAPGLGAPSKTEDSAQPHLSVLLPEGFSHQGIADDLAFHNNRYAPVGTGLQRIGVRFGWSAMAFAEIRDLNRHRTGVKYCPLVPKGFYFALDQLPVTVDDVERRKSDLLQVAEIGRSATSTALELLRKKEPTYLYWFLLGTELPFEHVTTADKFIYEAELRTGLGAHFRYAKHLRDALALWYRSFPETKNLILEGSAEPE
jgi:thymidylate synthase ThyX